MNQHIKLALEGTDTQAMLASFDECDFDSANVRNAVYCAYWTATEARVLGDLAYEVFSKGTAHWVNLYFAESGESIKDYIQ